MRDEFEYNPEETKTSPDNPFFDGTDGAHPAWWRGNDQGVLTTADLLKTIAETGIHRGTFGCEKLEAAAQVIKKLHYEANPGKGEPL
jgi:hypothetical protein